MRHLGLSCAVLLLAALPGLGLAQSYDDKVAETDMKDPESLYALAMWCEENNRARQKVRHLREAIKIDPDHAASREALGFVYYQKKWVHKSRVPKSAQGGGSGGTKTGTGGKAAGTEMQAGGPGPKASEIDWGLIPLTHPDIDSPRGQYVRSWVVKTQSSPNYSNAMESAWRTLLMEDHFEIAVAILSQGLASGEYKDLYAPAMMIDELRRTRDPRLATAEKLAPFVLAAGAKPGVKNEDLQVMAMMAASSGEKRAIPQLIDLMGSSDQFTADTAKMAISQITFLPEAALSKEKAQKWWDSFHSTPDSAIYGSLLTNKDPMVKLGACRRLYREQDKRILPVLVELLQSGNATCYNGACDLIKRICGNDWGLLDAEGETREKFIKQFADWALSEEGRRHVWVEFQKTDIGGSGGATRQVASDQTGQWVQQLNSLDADEKRGAYTALKNSGEKALKALIAGLGSTDAAIADKCRELLREITGENFGFNALGSDAEKAEAIKKWQAYAAEKLGAGAGETVVEEEEVEAPPAESAPKRLNRGSL